MLYSIDPTFGDKHTPQKFGSVPYSPNLVYFLSQLFSERCGLFIWRNSKSSAAPSFEQTLLGFPSPQARVCACKMSRRKRCVCERESPAGCVRRVGVKGRPGGSCVCVFLKDLRCVCACERESREKRRKVCQERDLTALPRSVMQWRARRLGRRIN